MLKHSVRRLSAASFSSVASFPSALSWLVAVSVITLSTNAAETNTNLGPLVYQVVEELPAGTLVGRGIITDAGFSSLYSAEQLVGLRFSLVRDPRSDVAGQHINVLPQSGLLEIKSPVDRDQLCPSLEVCSIKFEVVAVCPGGCFNVIAVVITILDVNDQTPTFTDQSSSSVVTNVTLTLPESSVPDSQFPLPAAIDIDSPAFGVAQYDLFPVEARSMFTVIQRRSSAQSSLPASSLQLVLTGSLDREAVSEYHLTVVAVDGGEPPLSATCSVKVVVGDVNDNDPVFQQSVYTIDVFENATTGTLLATVHATDVDDADNGHVTYHVLSTDDVIGDIITIDPLTGDLTLRADTQLDHEGASFYRFSVEARDHGLPVRSALTTVTLNVKDVNDNPPQVAISTLGEDGQGHVTENAPGGTFVGLISISDPDGGDNGLVSCHLEPEITGRMPFELVALSATTRYKLVSVWPLDRETVAEYHLTVVCTDRGSPSLSTRRDVVVSVDDVNDNEPRFRPDNYFRFTVNENVSIGDFVGQLSADDADWNNNALLSYRLVDFDRPHPPFSINSKTGVLTVTGQIDFETERLFEFQIEARDAGQPSLSSVANVTIDVIDVNDVTPLFAERLYRFSFAENQLDGDGFVGRVAATDPEVGDNGDIRYSLLEVGSYINGYNKENRSMNWRADKPFVVDPVTGKIMATRQLDRESISGYRFTVVAIDSGQPSLTGSCDVIVTVTDVNDHSPVIDFSSLSATDDVNSTGSDNVVYVSSAARRGRVVARVNGNDSDEGVNAVLSYYVTGGDEFFKITPSTGVVHVVSPDLTALDGRNVSLSVLVVDGGSPPRSASLNLTVVVNSSVELLPVDLTMYVDDDVTDEAGNRETAVASTATENSGRSRLLANPKFLIVFAVTTATGVVALALVAAILCVAFRSRWSRCETSGSRNQSSKSPSRGRRRGSHTSNGGGVGGGVYDERLSVLESLTGNDKLVPDNECGRIAGGQMTDALFGSSRCCHDFESFGKTDSMTRNRTATSPLRRNSQVIVISALPAAAEGDRDSASSDSGRGPSEDDFNATCSHNTSNSGVFPKPTVSSSIPDYAGSLHRRANNGYEPVPSSILYRSSALPRCTSHELALAVSCRPTSSSADTESFQKRSTAQSSTSSMPRASGHKQTGNTNHSRQDVNNRSLRRVTFSSPESDPSTTHQRHSAIDGKVPYSDSPTSPTPGYGSSSDAASMTSLTSGSYAVRSADADAEAGADDSWRGKPLSYIFV